MITLDYPKFKILDKWQSTSTCPRNIYVHCTYMKDTTVPEIIDPVFAKTSQNARFLLSENERFGLVFVKTGSINSGTGVVYPEPQFACICFDFILLC
jgi:hypothetical protein